MIDWLVNKLFWWAPLRNAIFAEVHMYDELDRVINEPTDNLSWEEGGLWYGYTYDSNAKRYYFDDVGHESLIDLWEHRLGIK
jgi:hypothetical protein